MQGPFPTCFKLTFKNNLSCQVFQSLNLSQARVSDRAVGGYDLGLTVEFGGLAKAMEAQTWLLKLRPRVPELEPGEGKLFGFGVWD